MWRDDLGRTIPNVQGRLKAKGGIQARTSGVACLSPVVSSLFVLSPDIVPHSLLNAGRRNRPEARHGDEQARCRRTPQKIEATKTAAAKTGYADATAPPVSGRRASGKEGAKNVLEPADDPRRHSAFVAPPEPAPRQGRGEGAPEGVAQRWRHEASWLAWRWSGRQQAGPQKGCRWHPAERQMS